MLHLAKTTGLAVMVCACLTASVCAAAVAAEPRDDAQDAETVAGQQPTSPAADRSWLAQLLLPTKVWSSAKADHRMLFELDTATEWGGNQQLLVLDTAQGEASMIAG